MKELTCIVCPRGCRLVVDDDLNVTGNTCPRGKTYAISELTNPTRMVTTTVRVENRDHVVCSVITSKPIQKDKVFDVIKLVNELKVSAPTKVGDVLSKNILGTDVDLIISKNID